MPLSFIPMSDDLPSVTFNQSVADEKDWTGVATTPVKDQGRCGSCWAFSAVEQIESMYKIQNNLDFIGAPQQLVDCKGDKSQRNGCNGGNPMEGYTVLQTLGGLEGEQEYPYRGQNQRCSFSADKVRVKVSNGRKISGGESGMKSYVGSEGPLSICHDTGGWQQYQRGILSSCGRGGGHCTQVVGYGTDNGVAYWKVRNSWGANYGESGHIRLAYGKNLCGLTQLPNTVDAAPAGPTPPSPTPTPPSPTPTPPTPTPPVPTPPPTPTPTPTPSLDCFFVLDQGECDGRDDCHYCSEDLMPSCKKSMIPCHSGEGSVSV